MTLRLVNWKVTDFNFNIKEKDNDSTKNSFDLDTSHFFPEDPDDKNTFFIAFRLYINDESYNIKLESLYEFKTDTEITEEFRNSNFPKINAPAIAFPYLRAFISNFTLQSGYEPIILPSINFVKAAKEKKSNN